MRVGPLLTRPDGTGPRPVPDGRRRLEAAVRGERQDGDRPARVVGDEDVPPRGVDDDPAGIGPFRDLPVEEREATRRGVDGERAHRARRLALERLKLVHGVEEAPVRVEGEVRRVLRLPGEDRIGNESPRGAVELEEVDPPAGAARVGADVDADRAALRYGESRRRAFLTHGRSPPPRDDRPAGARRTDRARDRAGPPCGPEGACERSPGARASASAHRTRRR